MAKYEASFLLKSTGGTRHKEIIETNSGSNAKKMIEAKYKGDIKSGTIIIKPAK